MTSPNDPARRAVVTALANLPSSTPRQLKAATATQSVWSIYATRCLLL